MRDGIPSWGDLETSWGAGVQIEAAPVKDETRVWVGKKAADGSVGRPPGKAEVLGKGCPTGLGVPELEKDEGRLENGETWLGRGGESAMV